MVRILNIKLFVSIILIVYSGVRASSTYSQKPARLPSGFGRSNPSRQPSAANEVGYNPARWKAYRVMKYDSSRKPYEGVQRRRSRSSGILTRRIIFANAVVFLLQVLNPNVTRWGANVPGLIQKQPRRYVTPIFLHGTLSHLAVNCYSLFSVGPELERILGNRIFLASYILSGVCGNVATSKFSRYPSVGASGAIFGLLGMYGVFVKRNEAFFGRSGEEAVSAIQRTTILNLVMGMFSPSIDNWGHIGGLAGGIGLSYLIGPRLYMMTAPTGGRILVNKPILEIPKFALDRIDEFPEQARLTTQRVMRRLRLEWYYMELPERKRRKLRYRRYNQV